jgi:DNA polymerase-3 subunit beta
VAKEQLDSWTTPPATPHTQGLSFSIPKGVFVKVLAAIQGVAERRNTIPVLGHVLLDTDAEAGTLTLLATDMEIALKETVKATVEHSGKTTVSAHMLYDIVRKLPDTHPITVCWKANDAGQLQIAASRSVFTLPILEAEIFPLPDIAPLPMAHTLPAGTLRSLLDGTRFAISTDETRYALNGVYLHRLAQEDAAATSCLRAVAVDAHRMAYRGHMISDETLPAAWPGVVLSRKAVYELIKFLDNAGPTTPVTLAVSPTHVHVTHGMRLLRTRVVDATFPTEYATFVPEYHAMPCVHVDRRAWMEAVDRVATVLVTEKYRVIACTLQPHSMVIASPNEGVGHAQEEIAITYEGPTYTLGFNGRYLLEMLNAVEGPTVHMHVNPTPGTPVVFTDPTDSEALFLIMPTHVQ